jgi:hypothetical protein
MRPAVKISVGCYAKTRAEQRRPWINLAKAESRLKSVLE